MARPRWKRSSICLFALVLLGIGGTMEASGADIPALEKQLINPCPNCGGMPLAGSYCGGATEAKKKIRELAGQGKTDEEILGAFVGQYGAWILATPPREGFTLLAWVLPVVGIVLGGGGLALFLKRARFSPSGRIRPEAERAQDSAPMNDAARDHYREALRRELGEL